MFIMFISEIMTVNIKNIPVSSGFRIAHVLEFPEMFTGSGGRESQSVFLHQTWLHGPWLHHIYIIHSMFLLLLTVLFPFLGPRG